MEAGFLSLNRNLGQFRRWLSISCTGASIWIASLPWILGASKSLEDSLHFIPVCPQHPVFQSAGHKAVLQFTAERLIKCLPSPVHTPGRACGSSPGPTRHQGTRVTPASTGKGTPCEAKAWGPMWSQNKLFFESCEISLLLFSLTIS